MKVYHVSWVGYQSKTFQSAVMAAEFKAAKDAALMGIVESARLDVLDVVEDPGVEAVNEALRAGIENLKAKLMRYENAIDQAWDELSKIDASHDERSTKAKLKAWSIFEELAAKPPQTR